MVDSTRHSRGSPAPPCIILSLRQLLLVVRPLRLLYSLEHWELALPDFFFFCLCFVFFVFFSFKASSKFEETALSIICRSFFHGRGAGRVPSAMRFHLLNPISGSRRSLPWLKHSSLLPQKLGAEVPEVILRTLSLLGEMNMSCVTSGVFHPFHRLKDRKICVRSNVHCRSKQGWGRESVSYS